MDPSQTLEIVPNGNPTIRQEGAGKMGSFWDLHSSASLQPVSAAAPLSSRSIVDLHGRLVQLREGEHSKR